MCEAVHTATQPRYPQNKATDSVILLQSCSFSKTPFSQVVELRGGPGRAGVPERVSMRRVSEATETLPQCILPHRAGLQGFFKAADENLATVEKLTRSFHAVYMVLFLSLFYL